MELYNSDDYYKFLKSLTPEELEKFYEDREQRIKDGTKLLEEIERSDFKHGYEQLKSKELNKGGDLKKTIARMNVESTVVKDAFSKNKVILHIKDEFNDNEIMTLEMDNTQWGRLCSGSNANSILMVDDCNNIGLDKEGTKVDYKYLRDKIDEINMFTTTSVMKLFQDFREHLKNNE